MTAEVVGFVLAAGSGTRLRPLTELRPKALCPVNNIALVDYALERMNAVTEEITVNAAHLHSQIVEHLRGRSRVVIEEFALGTAGAIASQKDWIAERAVLVHNADAWHQHDLASFVNDWDGESVRLLVSETGVESDFGTFRFCGVSLLPPWAVERLWVGPEGLYSQLWKGLDAQGRLDLVPYDGPYFDCGTPRDYLDANLYVSGGHSVVSLTAEIKGSINRCVVWDDTVVEAYEHLYEVIRAPGLSISATI